MSTGKEREMLSDSVIKSIEETTKKYWHHMTLQRYKVLQASRNARLTQEEIDAGWHFCKDWDGMLVHKDDVEMGSCTCEHGARWK